VGPRLWEALELHVEAGLLEQKLPVPVVARPVGRVCQHTKTTCNVHISSPPASTSHPTPVVVLAVAGWLRTQVN
jgi:hypothetical protein